MVKVAEVMERVKSAPNSQAVRDLSCVKVGEVVRQGDVYLKRIAKLDGDEKEAARRVKKLELVKHHELSGPVVARVKSQKFEAVEDVVLTHPEHAHCKIPADTCWEYKQQIDHLTQSFVRD